MAEERQSFVHMVLVEERQSFVRMVLAGERQSCSQLALRTKALEELECCMPQRSCSQQGLRTLEDQRRPIEPQPR